MKQERISGDGNSKNITTKKIERYINRESSRRFALAFIKIKFILAIDKKLEERGIEPVIYPGREDERIH
jgi:hypothetical protein